MNLLPLILAQSGQNGANGQGQSISPEVMQTMMMNAMMPDLNFNMNDNNR